MKKKVVTLSLVVALIATAAIGGTLAYFTDTDKAENVFTVGKVSIDLTEPKWDNNTPDNKEDGGEGEAKDVYAGEALAKDPTVTNDGENPCFVRIEVTGWDCLAPAGEITYRTDYVEKKLGENWALHDDGYFYYTKPLAVGATTDALFDQIVMPTNLTNDVNGNEYKLNVVAHAVQAQGAKASYADVEKMTVAEIAKWFGTVAEAENIVF